MNRPLVRTDELEAVARRFEVLGEPARLKLLSELQTAGEQAVGELVEATGFQQSNVSKHLRTLTEEGLLTRRRDGVHVYYALDDPTLGALCLLVRKRLQDERGR